MNREILQALMAAMIAASDASVIPADSTARADAILRRIETAYSEKNQNRDIDWGWE